MMDLFEQLAAWAWARHHNPLSWYVRPLFFLPWMYFAWRRSPAGLAATLLALVTSMAWFPAPAVPDPRVEGFLAAEREWILGEWTAAKVALALLAPLSLGALAWALWRRSVATGVVVLVAVAVGKTVWAVHEGGDSGWAVAPPAITGLVLCIGILLGARAWARRREHSQATIASGSAPASKEEAP